MKPLYALPDHEVIRELIPGVGDTHLKNHSAIARIRSIPGLIPVAIDPGTEGAADAKVLWADIGAHPFREWQFSYTLQHLATSGLIGQSFTTDFSILQEDAILTDPIEPSGFIFHVGRCGSTLVAKAIARSPYNVVINEGGPLQKGFWQVLTQNWSKDAAPSHANLKAFRNLVLAMARRRQSGQRNSFVKVISWNILYLDFIMAAFPKAAALFLYRDPVEVIASVQRGTTSILLAKGQPHGGFLAGCAWQDTAGMDAMRYMARCIARYLRTALGAPDRVKVVNYLDITPAHFPAILRDGLGFLPEREELDLMIQQFRFHAKDDSDNAVFVPDSAIKQSAVATHDKVAINAESGGLVDLLDHAPQNLFRRPPG